MGTQVNIDNEIDRWRWCCPNGHRSWEPTNNHFWCQQCARHYEAPGEFHELHDLSSGETVGREEIVLMTDVGPYREVYGKGGAP